MPHPFALFALPPRSTRQEILDLRPATAQEIDINFDEIALVNRFLGGTRAVRVAVNTLLAASDAPQCVRLLDVAAGGADIPRALVKCARRGGFGVNRTLHITATDINDEILAHARRRTSPADYPEIAIEPADALALPFPDDAFDYATCSMALHHFDPPRAARLFREMARVSKRGIIVNDLRRDRTAAMLIWTLTRVLRAHPITQHDAPLSVLRAYTPDEVRMLFAEAGLIGDLAIRRVRMYRLVASYRPI